MPNQNDLQTLELNNRSIVFELLRGAGIDPSVLLNKDEFEIPREQLDALAQRYAERADELNKVFHCKFLLPTNPISVPKVWNALLGARYPVSSRQKMTKGVRTQVYTVTPTPEVTV